MKELEKEEGRKHRNHTKTGKLAAKRETRRLEAIGRQVKRVMELEKSLEKAKFKVGAQANLAHAQLTLQKIRGGTEQRALEKYSTAVAPATPEKPTK